MPTKYRPTKDDYFFVTSALSVYGMLHPIEEKLVKGGYRGNVLADYYDQICVELGKDPHPDMALLKMINNADMEVAGEMLVDQSFCRGNTLTKSGARAFHNYVKKYMDHVELLIRNTPPEEYPEELAELKYHQAYYRMLKVMGARELLQDQLGFLPNARNFDADTASIKEWGNPENRVYREKWIHMRKYYPYSELRDSYAELINLACDREESTEKESYTEEIEYREKYKKALQNYITVNQALNVEPYGKELLAAGCHVNEMNFTGDRGNRQMFSEVEAQINAIDMGWPVDELIHIQRLQMIIRPSIGVKYNNVPGLPDFKNRCREFYEQRIKDKKYPATAEDRQAFYRDFYALAQEADTVIRGEFEDNYGEDTVTLHWDKFKKGMKEPAEKRHIRHGLRPRSKRKTLMR